MGIPWKAVGWISGISAGFAGLIGVYMYSLPPTEEDIKDAGYKPEIKSTLTCYSGDGRQVLKEHPESVMFVNSGSVTVKATYPSFFDGTKDVVTRRPSIVGNLAGCLFQTTYTASDISEMRNTLPMLVNVFNGETSLINARYSKVGYNRDSGVFSAETEDENGILLETIQVVGLPYISTQVTPTIPLPAGYK